MRRGDAALTLEETAVLIDRLAALSRAGLAPGPAWQVMSLSDGPWRPVADRVTAQTLAGSPVGTALVHSLQGTTAQSRLWWLAQCYLVIEGCGAPVATVMEAVSASIRDQLAADQERDTALAGPRATALVLALLPLTGPVLGLLVGANPLAALLGSGAGRQAGLLGLLAWALGLWWTQRLVARARAAGQ